jgi:hypothetical protein
MLKTNKMMNFFLYGRKKVGEIYILYLSHKKCLYVINILKKLEQV